MHAHAAIAPVTVAELDYRREADNVESFRRIHDGDEAIVIPRVFHSLLAKRVITLELIGGQDYATFCKEGSQEERTEASKTIWRFMFRALFKHGVLYADPHPGNYRFLGGGRVAFLDFGCIKVMPPSLVAGHKRVIIAAMDQDWEEFEKACVDVLGYDPTDTEAFKLFIAYSRLVLKPFTTDAVYRQTHEKAHEAVAFLVRGGKKLVKPKEGDILPNLPKPVNAPKDHTFMNRLQWGLASVLAGLGGEANFRAISEPWVRGPLER